MKNLNSNVSPVYMYLQGHIFGTKFDKFYVKKKKKLQEIFISLYHRFIFTATCVTLIRIYRNIALHSYIHPRMKLSKTITFSRVLWKAIVNSEQAVCLFFSLLFRCNIPVRMSRHSRCIYCQLRIFFSSDVILRSNLLNRVQRQLDKG